LAACAVCATVLLTPRAASAHAELTSSEPVAGAVLGTAPGVVTLNFSGQIEPSLSSITVTAPGGQRFTGSGSGTTMQATLATNLPGNYEVGWTAVSADDGHTTSGSFSFSVVAPGRTGARASSVGGAGALDYAVAVARAIELIALFLAVGVMLMRTLAAWSPRLDWARLDRAARWPLLIAFVCGLVAVAGDARLASASAQGMWRYLSHGEPSISRLTLVWAEALAVVAEVTGVSIAAWVFTLGSLAAVGAAGHGGSLEPRWFGISLYAVHLWSAALWAGGIASLLLLRPEGGWRADGARALLDRFSPVALTAFGATVVTGAVQATRYIGSLSELTSSAYGRWLIVKAVAIVAMIPLSWFAWRRRDVRRVAEASLAASVVLFASFMAANPPPALATPSSASASAQGGPSRANPAFPHGGELTLGDHAGQVLVGLSISPARPGANTAYLYLQPLYVTKTPIPVSMTVNGEPVALQTCAYGCRRAGATLRGDGNDRVVVTVAGAAGGTTTFDLPTLPAADGTTLLDLANTTMHSLQAYAVNELLGTGITTVHTVYRYRAPHSVAIDLLSGPGAGSQTVIIGSTRWTRSGPRSAWVAQPAVPIPVPSFIWDYFRPAVDARIVGQQTLGGTPTTIVAFFGTSGDIPVWFRLWIDRKGFVHRAEMRAEGHFMDHSYADLNGGFTVTPPPGAPKLPSGSPSP
jgi:copper transport protein